MPELVTPTPRGLYCAAGDFYIDPWKPVPRALLTHAHADHAVLGSGEYLCATPGLSIAKKRLPDANIQSVAYGEPFERNGVRVSFHPAGHVLGSAQIRVEFGGEVWVVSGDYKRASDATCASFEPVRCDTFISEATFGLPVYRWDAPGALTRELFTWWQEQAALGRTALLFCYSLGKSQRVLSELCAFTDRPIHVHGAIDEMTALYRDAGVKMLPTERVVDAPKGRAFAGELVLAPISARGTPWMKRLGDTATALASGWMRVRGERRRRNLERGFALSDHADFPALLTTVKDSGATRILFTHGYAEELAHHVRELGLDAQAISTEYSGEVQD